MVGRIEIVSPEQRALLAELAGRGRDIATGLPAPEPGALNVSNWNERHQVYEKLGRFRNALLLDEQKRRPSVLLEAFINRFSLQGYTPPRDRETLMRMMRYHPRPSR